MWLKHQGCSSLHKAISPVLLRNKNHHNNKHSHSACLVSEPLNFINFIQQIRLLSFPFQREGSRESLKVEGLPSGYKLIIVELEFQLRQSSSKVCAPKHCLLPKVTCITIITGNQVLLVIFRIIRDMDKYVSKGKGKSMNTFYFLLHVYKRSLKGKCPSMLNCLKVYGRKRNRTW